MKTSRLKQPLAWIGAAAMALGVGGTAVASNSAEAHKARSCASIGSEAAFLSSQQHEIEAVKPLKRTRRIGKVPMQHVVGAQVTVLPHEGLTKQYLQRVINCQVARELGQVATGDVPEVSASVEEQDGRFVVNIAAENSQDGKQVKELVERALEQRSAVTM